MVVEYIEETCKTIRQVRNGLRAKEPALCRYANTGAGHRGGCRVTPTSSEKAPAPAPSRPPRDWLGEARAKRREKDREAAMALLRELLSGTS